MSEFKKIYYYFQTDSTKRKQMRILADKQYIKSASLLESMEHPNELLRVYLERLAMKDQCLTSKLASLLQELLILVHY